MSIISTLVLCLIGVAQSKYDQLDLAQGCRSGWFLPCGHNPTSLHDVYFNVLSVSFYARNDSGTGFFKLGALKYEVVEDEVRFTEYVPNTVYQPLAPYFTKLTFERITIIDRDTLELSPLNFIDTLRLCRH
ncbi:hypothetical protein FOL47_008360 [Perkinsus chesapeaki]|uniref:Uncharacterized protein n=1 Tax=Perkinsus chesapeaki TaxID=330153 RepID=A0A7J6LEK4_PERCH|nr:hypothetical protein FOL47_008360 [Perkinsus chesapeaki]